MVQRDSGARTETFGPREARHRYSHRKDTSAHGGRFSFADEFGLWPRADIAQLRSIPAARGKSVSTQPRPIADISGGKPST
jgi:hypothetical protein